MPSSKLRAESGTFKITGFPPEVRVRGRLPDDHPAYALIGRVAAAWAELEHILDLIIWELAELGPETGSCITAQMNGHGPRFRAIAALAARHGLERESIAKVNGIMNETTRLAIKYRNRYVHDAWYFEESTGHVSQFKSITTEEKTFGFHKIEDTAVKDAIYEIMDRTNCVLRLKQTLSEQLRSSRQKSP